MDQQRQILWVTWSVLVLSLGIYAGVAALGIKSSNNPDLEFAHLMATALFVLAIPTAGLTFILRNRLITRPITRGSLDPSSPSGAQKLMRGFMLTWVISEAVGIWGLVLWFLSGSWSLFLPLLIAGAFLLGWHAPREALFTRPATLEDLAAGRGTIG